MGLKDQISKEKRINNINNYENNNNNQSRDKSKMQCFRCKKFGHFARDCRSERQESFNKVTTFRGMGKGFPKTFKRPCQYCNLIPPKHRRTCPKILQWITK